MSRPDDISDRAWAFACEQWPEALGVDVFGTSHVQHRRHATARFFDKATEDLRDACGYPSGEDAEPCELSDSVHGDRLRCYKHNHCTDSLSDTACPVGKDFELLASYTPKGQDNE
jgi:hypothetical protein